MEGAGVVVVSGEGVVVWLESEVLVLFEALASSVAMAGGGVVSGADVVVGAGARHN